MGSHQRRPLPGGLRCKGTSCVCVGWYESVCEGERAEGTGLDKEGLERMLESGDRARRIEKGGLEMGEDLRGRLTLWILRQVDQSLGWRAAPTQGRANLALPEIEPFPDALPGPLAPLTIDGAAGGQYAAGNGGLQEPPQSHSGQAEPPDFVGGPDAERPPATAPCLAVTARRPAGHAPFFAGDCSRRIRAKNRADSACRQPCSEDKASA